MKQSDWVTGITIIKAVSMMQSVQKSKYLSFNTVMLTTAWSSNDKRFAQQSAAAQTAC